MAGHAGFNTLIFVLKKAVAALSLADETTSYRRLKILSIAGYALRNSSPQALTAACYTWLTYERNNIGEETILTLLKAGMSPLY